MGGIDCVAGGGNGGIRGPCVVANGVGNAARFNGSSFLQEAEFLVVDYPFTMNLWLRTSSQAFHVAASLAISTNSTEHRVGIDSNGEAEAVSVEDSVSTGTATDSATGDIADGDWYMLTARFTSDTLRSITVNAGTPVTDVTDVNFVIGTRLRLARSGTTGQGGALDGDLDQVAIFSDVLSDDEVTWMYDSGSGRTFDDIDTSGDADNPGDANLIAHYSLNEDDPGGIGSDDVGSFDLSTSGTIVNTDGIPAGD